MQRDTKHLPRPVRILIWIVVVGTALVVSGVFSMPYVYPKIAVRVMAAMPSPSLKSLAQRVAVASVARNHRPTVFNASSPAEAGRALHALVAWTGIDVTSAVLLPFPRVGRRDISEVADPNAPGIDPRGWYRDLILRAAVGLSAEQRRFLERVADDPNRALYERFAGARDLDVLGTRFTFGRSQSSLAFFQTLPLPRASSVKRSFQGAYARAALQFARRRADSAEATLREAVNGALLLVDNDNAMVDMLVGALAAKQSLTALAALYDATGRSAEAEQIKKAMDAAAHAVPDRALSKHLTTGDSRRVLPALAARTDLPPAVKWELLGAAEALNIFAYCVGEYTFDQAFDVWRADLRRRMVHRKSDVQFFDWITEPPQSRDQCPSGEPGASPDNLI